MDYAMIAIGMDKDADGNPLITADGKLLGTVEQVKAMIERFEQSDGNSINRRIQEALRAYDATLQNRVMRIVDDARKRNARL